MRNQILVINSAHTERSLKSQKSEHRNRIASFCISLGKLIIISLVGEIKILNILFP